MMTEEISQPIGLAVDNNQEDNQRNPRDRGRPMVCLI
jgi:hypothetical protein